MGASDAYGGSAGWNDTRGDTNDWIDSRPGSAGGEGPGGDGTGDEPPGGDAPPIPGDGPPSPSSPEGLDPGIARILAGIAGRLGATIATTTSSSGRARGGGREAGGGGSGDGGGGARGRAATSGGVAIAGAYGLRSGGADSVGDAGLSLADLGGLSPFQQAQRIVDAASGKSALIEQDEIREVNANFMWWSIEQEQPSPAELVKAWVTEFVYRTWLTEAGSVLRDGTRDGAATHALEREVRVTLEAAVSRVALPTQGLRAADFQEAISQLLGTLERIFSEAAA